MSNLLSQASLVMIPSGYKEDVVYSAVPTNGNGDLSFTRASNGTRVNSAGLVEVVAWNLLQYSEDFSNAVWTKGNLTITTDSTTAPNGTTTADKAIPNTTNGAHGLENTGYLDLTIGQTYTASFYAKASGYNFIQFLADGGDISGNPRANFNLSNGTLGSVDTGLTASIESVGNGWYRCVVSFVVAYNIFNMGLYVSDSSTASRPPVFTGNGTDGVFIWGAQLNIGSTAKPYFPTTDRLNVPRLTYQNGGGGCPSLLLEKQSTNLVTYSEQFDNAAWIKLNGSVTANTSISPDGTQNADSFIPNTTSGIHALRSNLFNQSSTAAHSWFVKANGYTKIAVRESELVGNYATFNLSTGTLISTNQTGSIQNLGNGWYRCTLVDTTTGANAQTSIVVLPDSYTSGDPIVVNWSGDGTKGVFAWGAQVEISSYPTSYIPTTSSSATRVADACSKTGISSLIGQTEGVIFVEANVQSGYDANNLFITVSGSNTDDMIFINRVAGKAEVFVGTSGVAQFGYVMPTILSSGKHKLAIAYKQNDFAFYIDGVLVQSDTSGTVPAMNRVFVGSYFANALPYNDGISQAILFPTRLTNAELASLTTI